MFQGIFEGGDRTPIFGLKMPIFGKFWDARLMLDVFEFEDTLVALIPNFTPQTSIYINLLFKIINQLNGREKIYLSRYIFDPGTSAPNSKNIPFQRDVACAPRESAQPLFSLKFHCQGVRSASAVALFPR